MIYFEKNCRIYVGLEAIDFRCGLNKLVPLAKRCFEKDPKDSCIFVFRNKRRTDIKLLLFDRNGFFLGHKRLSRGKLQWWPRTQEECLGLDGDQLLKLLVGVDPRGSYHPTWKHIGESVRKEHLRDQDYRYRGSQGSSYQESAAS